MLYQPTNHHASFSFDLASVKSLPFDFIKLNVLSFWFLDNGQSFGRWVSRHVKIRSFDIGFWSPSDGFIVEIWQQLHTLIGLLQNHEVLEKEDETFKTYLRPVNNVCRQWSGKTIWIGGNWWITIKRWQCLIEVSWQGPFGQLTRQKHALVHSIVPHQ